METINRETFLAYLDAFKISEKLGFVLEEPLTNLPEYYQIWMHLANNTTHLIELHKLQEEVDKMPLLSLHRLTSHKELRLAHLALGCICSGYVWQEGKNAPAQTIPKALALPFWLLSRMLGLPAILTYADVILANWKLKDPMGDMDVSNMDSIFNFPGGESSRGFFVVSVLVEMAASSGIQGTLTVMHAMETSDLTGIKKGLIRVTQSLKKMKEVFKLMHNQVDADEFFGTLRIFFYGWRDNPLIPNGLLYEGVSDEPVALSGSSAAQSSAIQCFDALLGIQHENDTESVLTHMRDYMPPAHSQLIVTLSALSLRDFVFSCSNSDLCQHYNACVSALVELRTYHFSIVTKYVIVPNNRAHAITCPLSEADLKTGSTGSNAAIFLKSIRNTTKKALILD